MRRIAQSLYVSAPYFTNGSEKTVITCFEPRTEFDLKQLVKENTEAFFTEFIRVPGQTPWKWDQGQSFRSDNFLNDVFTIAACDSYMVSCIHLEIRGGGDPAPTFIEQILDFSQIGVKSTKCETIQCGRQQRAQIR